MDLNNFITESARHGLTCEQYYQKIQGNIAEQSAYNKQFTVRVIDFSYRFFTFNYRSFKHQVADLEQLENVYSQVRSTALSKLRTRLQPLLIQKRQAKALKIHTEHHAQHQAHLVPILAQIKRTKALDTLRASFRPTLIRKKESVAVRIQAAKTVQGFCRMIAAQTIFRIKQKLHKERIALSDLSEIQDGHGEWIVRKRAADGFEPVNLATYTQVSKIFEEYHPVKWAMEQDEALLPQRVTLLKEKVKSIDGSLELTFIPRTLYDLTFMRNSAEEDLAKEKDFLYQDPDHPTKLEIDQVRTLSEKYNQGWIRAGATLELAHRLNEIFSNILNTTLQNRPSFKYGELKGLLDRHLLFFQEVHEGSKSKIAEKAGSIACCNVRSPLSSFSSESTRGMLQPIGLKEEWMADIVRQALSLECLKGKIVMYRGSCFNVDYRFPPYSHSLSYGMGLFAHFLNDYSACPFWYMRKSEKDAHALVLDAHTLRKKVFFAPHKSALEDLFSMGEYVHGRSMLHTDHKGTESVFGIEKNPTYDKVPSFLKSPLTRGEFSAAFKKQKNLAVVLHRRETRY